MSVPSTAAMRCAAAFAAAALTLGALLPAGRAAAQGAEHGPLAQVAPPVEAVTTLPADWPEGPAASATSYLLLDQLTGQVLAERDADVRRPVASTIKVLTALVVLHRSELTDPVTIGSEVNGVGGASTGLAPGQVRTVGELLDALVARSGNDAAVALAVHTAGSVEAFALLMREEAAALGVRGATIITPSGLDDRNLLSARDLATITRAAMADPRFRAIAAKPTVVIGGRVEISRNELLGAYAGATGVKTGFTEAAGYAFIGSAQREGRELLAVVLNSRTTSSRFSEAATLLDHGFTAFTPTPLAGRNRLRRAGQWVLLQSPSGIGFLAPADDPELEVLASLPVDLLDDPLVAVDVRWRGDLLGTVRLTALTTPRPDVEGDAAVGRWLWDRAYAAMRAVPPTAPDRRTAPPVSRSNGAGPGDGQG